MRILHVIPSLSLRHGGPSRAIMLACNALSKQGLEITIAATAPRGKDERILGPSTGGANAMLFPPTTNLYSTSIPLWQWLRREIRRFDLVHIHELFTFPSVAGARRARAHGVPYVLTPHGVLMRWGRRNRRPILKRVSTRLIEARIVERAQLVHFTTESERLESVEVSTPSRAVVFPLGIDLSEFDAPADAGLLSARFPALKGRPFVLFLSRLHPVKGIELLLRAFALLPRAQRPAADPVLVVTGEGSSDYAASLRRLAESPDLRDRVVFTGFLGREERLAALAGAACLIQPSLSESFGLAVVEALASGLPVVLTQGVALHTDVTKHGAGIAVRPVPHELSSAMRTLLEDRALRESMGERARRLAWERFSVVSTANRLRAAYAAVLA